MEQTRLKVLVVDDTPDNIHVLMETLKDDYAVVAATSGERALKLAGAPPRPDIILLDVMMPGMNGYEVCRRLKADPATSAIPVIFVTSLAESEEEAKGLALGAVDYITKPFNPAILKARLGNHMALRRAYLELEQSREALSGDLARAAEYVLSQLPAKLTEGPIRADWLFTPCASLGGDALGYRFLDGDHFAFYLLDVCSHGVGPALLSVQALNVLRYESMPGVDFRDPAQVLAGLNAIFQMHGHNDLYFTIVYGVFGLRDRTLTMASAGHPPPLLFGPDGGMRPLKKQSIMIGAMPDAIYKTLSLDVAPGSHLYLFSDGVYEVQRPKGDYMTYEQFAAFMPQAHARGENALDAVLAHARATGCADTLPDDFSLLRLAFLE